MKRDHFKIPSPQLPGVLLLGFFLFMMNISLKGQNDTCDVSVDLQVKYANGCINDSVYFFAEATNAGDSSSFQWSVNGAVTGNTSSTLSGNGFQEGDSIAVIVYSDTACSPRTSDTAIHILEKTNDFQAVYSFEKIECDQKASYVFVENINGGIEPYNITVNGSPVKPDKDRRIGLYDVGEQLIIITTDSSGCQDTDTLLLEKSRCEVRPFNVFSPNGDGIEDTWRIINIQQYPDNEVFVYNRYGQRVFHQKNYNNAEGWDGKYLGKVLPVATYYFIIELYENQQGDIVREKGAVSIIK